MGKVEGLATPHKPSYFDYTTKISERKVESLIENPDLITYDSFPDVMPYPYDEIMREFAKAFGVSPAVPISAFLTAIGAAAGKRWTLEVKTNKRIHPNIWTILIGQSGTGKSPATKSILEGLFELEKENYKRYKRELNEYSRQAAENKKNGFIAEPPVYRQLIVEDTTIEALSIALQGNENGILLYTDELASFLLGMDKYKQKESGTKEKLLSAYDGGAWKINRITRETIFIPNALVSIFGTIQPEVLKKAFSEEDFYNGFLQRFCFFFTPDNDLPVLTDATISIENRKKIKELYERLINNTISITIQMTDMARSVYVDWYSKLSEEKDKGFSLSFLAKLDIQVLKLALIFTILEDKKVVDELNIKRAIVVGEYLKRTHLKVVNTLNFDETTREIAKAILALQEKNGSNIVLTQDLQNYLSETGLFIKPVELGRILRSKLKLQTATRTQNKRGVFITQEDKTRLKTLFLKTSGNLANF
ncbi:DUF3987 domain-containing protein [Hippea alviniae]|uniref:DUF3987 domain-containing protein n=1 Tax=Hippea alviniae TaxID=1279027 RepID=UPI0003B33CC2|nr:DUF3987 domain-containing protein [Hippea alviniae]